MPDLTLKEIVDALPEDHVARDEYNALIEELNGMRVVTTPPPHPPEAAPVAAAPPPLGPPDGDQ